MGMIEKYRAWINSHTNKSYTEWSLEEIRTPESVNERPNITGDPYEAMANSDARIIGEGCRLIYEKVLETVNDGCFPLTVGGDHSIASATISATLSGYPELAVIWVDAHADSNTPDTSPSLHYHGMPAAHLMGWFKKEVPGFEFLKNVLGENRLAFIGLRDVDAEEGVMLQKSGCHV